MPSFPYGGPEMLLIFEVRLAFLRFIQNRNVETRMRMNARPPMVPPAIARVEIGEDGEVSGDAEDNDVEVGVLEVVPTDDLG